MHRAALGAVIAIAVYVAAVRMPDMSRLQPRPLEVAPSMTPAEEAAAIRKAYRIQQDFDILRNGQTYRAELDNHRFVFIVGAPHSGC